LCHIGYYDAAVVWERERVSRPEEVEAPNGVRAVEHRLDGESRVRAEAGASHTVEEGTPVEVQTGAGALWVSVPPGGVEVQVNHGGFSALVSSGAAMVDAGEGSDGLLLVTSGEVLLVDAAGTSRVLSAGDAAVLGADGDLAGVDQVADEELEGDPWAVANRALDAEVVLPEPEPEPEPEVEPEPEPEDEVEEPDEEPAPIPAIIDTQAVEVVDDDEIVEDEGGEAWPPAPEEPAEEPSELLDELYAPSDDEAHEVSGRSVARVLEIAALVVFIGVIVLLVFLFNRNEDDGGGPTAIGDGVSTVQPTSSTTSTTERTTTESTATTTAAPVKVVINVLTCTQKGEALVAVGDVSGAPESAEGYRITVQVVLGKRVFGKETVTVDRGDNEKGRTSWTAEVALNGDAVGAGAECKVPEKGGVTLI
jgi:uncharacterized cupin superfamily protein